jgi:hypothetical protein
MDRSSANTEAKGLLFDANQILSSELYESKEDEDKLAALPELQRELILAECVDKIKRILMSYQMHCHSKCTNFLFSTILVQQQTMLIRNQYWIQNHCQ